MKKKLKKNAEKIIEMYMEVGFIGITLLTALVCFGIKMLEKNKISVVPAVRLSVAIIGLMNLIVLVTIIVIRFFKETKRGIHFVRHCDIPFFEKIDNYKRCYQNNIAAYERAYYIINLYYKNNGKKKSRVAEYAEENGLEDLYIRKDFLQKDINLYQSLLTYVSGFFVGLIQSLCIDTGEQSTLNFMIFVSIGMVMFVCVFFWQYSSRGQMGSFVYEVAEYEYKLLDEVIQAEKEKRVMSSEKEYLLNMQQVLIDAMKNYKKTWKVKLNRAETKEVEEDLKIVEGLRLYDECNYAMIVKKEYHDCTIGYSDYRCEIGKSSDDNCKLRKLYIKYNKRCELPELFQFKDVDIISCCETDHRTG